MLIVSVLMLEGEDREKIFSRITAGHLTDPAAREIFGIFRGIWEKYPDADGAAFLSALNEEQKAPLSAAINEMMSPGIAKLHLDDTIGAIREQYAARRKSELLTGLMLREDVTAADIRRTADEIEELGGTAKRDPGAEYIAHYGDEIRRFPTGFESLDELLEGGFAEGTIAAIGARPSTGKTTFALNIAAHNPDKRVLFISIEMTARMIYDRLVSDIANVKYSLAAKHEVAPETVKAVIDDYGGLTVVDDIAAVEDICSMIYAEKPDIVFIDFVQIITAAKKFPDNRQRIDHISQMLKMTAKAVGCCIVTLSQITRAGKDKPTMSDLKESGGLEQDSDYVLILHRPYVVDKSDSKLTPKDTTVTLDKNKFGNTRELKFDFDGQYQRFTEEGGIARPTGTAGDIPF